jgi:hypothetical protein
MQTKREEKSINEIIVSLWAECLGLPVCALGQQKPGTNLTSQLFKGKKYCSGHKEAVVQQAPAPIKCTFVFVCAGHRKPVYRESLFDPVLCEVM